ncbi:Arylsulfatase [Gimesia maris]|nr:Arylsulfatase [Gimesia maris]
MICSPRLQVFDSARPEFSESRVAFAFPVSYSVMQASASGNSGLHPITGMNGRAGSFKTQFSESTAMKLILHLTVLFFVSFGSLYADDKPNIVFFFADDQTTSTLGCYGNQVVKTPNIDELAVRGTRFSNACVSQAICWVSRTTILTGLTGRSYGTPANPEMTRPDAVETLYTDLLRENGYRVGFYGKWHAKMPKGFQREKHFDEFEAISRNPYYKKQPDGSLRHETELIVDRGIEFLKTQPKGKPFALNLWFNACHAEDSDRRPGIGHFPWPRAVDGMYEDVTIAPPRLNAPEIFDGQPDFLKTTINRERYFWRWNTDDKYQTNMRAYYRMVSGIDGAIGRFLGALKEAGLDKNTIIVYSADNGYYMGNRGFAGKWSHYEEALNVPLIVVDPRVTADQRGQVVSAPALNLDLPATFLDWAGVKVPERYQGKSLQPIVAGKTPDNWRKESFHEHFAVRNRIPAFEGLRNDRFKYVRYFDHGGHEFLHDLKQDPDELVNLAGHPQFQDTLKEMRERTTSRVNELGGPLDPLKGKFTDSTVPHPVASAAVGAKADSEGFVSVFDGKSLRHWSGDPQYWSVEEGALTGRTDGTLKMNRFITWKDSTIRNFDLRVKVKVTAGGNSGLQYRGTSRPDLGLDIVTGYQCDVVANNPNYNGMLYEEKGRRILSHTGEKVIIDPEGQPWVVGKIAVKPFAPDEWHEFRVLVAGNHHQHWIDDHKTADLIDLDEKGRALEGVLAVQVHVGPQMKIQYKDFKIKHLPDDLPLHTAKENPIPADAYGVRPQGRLPRGWTPPVYGKR